MQVFRILWISLECCDQSQPCGKRISSKVFGHSFVAGGNHKEGRRFSAFSAFLSAERALSEVACHKAAFGRWRFRRDQFQPCGKRISSKVFGRSFAAKRKFKEVRRYSIVLVKEFHLPSHRPRSLCEVTCCNAASRCWKFRTIFFPLTQKYGIGVDLREIPLKE